MLLTKPNIPNEVKMEHKIEVINNRHEGYRRAGLTLAKGKNEFSELTAEQIKMLQTDPSLTVTIEVENSNEDFGDTFGDTNSTGGNSELGAGKTDGKENSDGESNGTTGENSDKNPEPPKSYFELSQAVMVALAEQDPLIYFNMDGSPRIAKWKEVTGNEALTKPDVIAAIAAAKNQE